MKKNREQNADFRFSLLVMIIGIVCAGLSLTVLAKTSNGEPSRETGVRPVVTHNAKHP